MMSIEEIKDIKKLQKRLKSALDELKYIKKCCENAGLELAKYSFAYDHKEKNLVIQALELNERFERREQALDEIKYQTTELYIGVENKDRPYCEKILDIINKAKDGE